MKNILDFKLFESFYYGGDSSLETLNNSIRTIIINLSDYGSFKFNYLVEQYKIDLLSFKKEISLNPYDKNFNIDSVLKSLRNDIDDDLISALKVDKLFNDISECISTQDVENVQNSIIYLFDVYISNLEKYINSLDDCYKNKVKKDKKYSQLKGIKVNNNDIGFSDYRKQKYLLQIELNKLSEWVFKNKRRVVVIVDGRDAAGKSSTIKKMTENINQAHHKVVKLGIPTEDEKKNWFERYQKHLPKPGEMAFFDRSWYNRAVIEPSMGWCTDQQFKDFYKNVEKFEMDIKKQGIDIIKIWLSIDESTQRLRFELRKTNPLKYWKYSNTDKKIGTEFEKLTPYIDKMLRETNFKGSNWKVIDANDKKLSKLSSIYYLLSNFDYDHKNIEIFKNIYY